jgi:hypothetical protein
VKTRTIATTATAAVMASEHSAGTILTAHFMLQVFSQSQNSDEQKQNFIFL